MLQFNQFITEKTSLHVFDVDDTLVHSKAQVHVKNAAGHTVQKLSTSEYNTHKLPAGHHYDYHEFRSSDVFKKTSHPIKNMIRTINAAQASSSKNPKNRTMISTARADFDDKHKFLGTLKAHGVHHIDKIHVHRAGNIPGDQKPEHKKLIHIRGALAKQHYDHVKMYDDSKPNLNAFLSLKREYPKTKFTAYHVGEGGKMSVHGSA